MQIMAWCFEFEDTFSCMAVHDVPWVASMKIDMMCSMWT
jgi:hypothetical protein